MRRTRHDYTGPGSFERLQEAGICCADADPEDDADYAARCARLRAAALAYVLGVSVIRRVITTRGELCVTLRVHPESGLGVLARTCKGRKA